jgi:hypothetical protein
VGLDGLVSGSARSAKVCNQLAVRHNRVGIVDHSHALAMHASGYRHLVDKHNLCGPKRYERVKPLDNSGVFGFAGNPRLVFLGIHAAPLDDAEADVNDVTVGHRVSRATGICRTGE